jgi:thiol-disulfide isomerase/thioredoxin
VNPSLPGGASAVEIEPGDWSAGARLGYAFVPYGRLQQGMREAANPSGLGIDVHLATLQLVVAAPTNTSLDLQLPAGTLITTTVDEQRSDSGLGDLEVRVRQAFARAPFTFAGALGIVAPTGPYVARSGEVNLAPEASYLTLGRGIAWWLVDLDASLRIDRTTLAAQVAARGPVSRTSDEFAWGPELRVALTGRYTVTRRVSALATGELQWRGGASEPDPFSDGRLDAANAGGWAISLMPAASVLVGGGVQVVAGARIPLVNDVTGNQLVPQLGGFVSVSYTQPLVRPRRQRFAPTAGTITVVDYTATWCAPCADIARALAAAAPRWPDVRIVTIDASGWPGDGPALPPGATGLPAVEVFDTTGTRRMLLLGKDALRVVDEVDALRAIKQRN